MTYEESRRLPEYGHQPGGSAIKQNDRLVCASPAESVQPPVEVKLGSQITKITESAMAANLHGVVPASLTFSVIEEGAELFDLELPRETVDDAVWHIRKIFKEGAKEPSRAKLDGKAQTPLFFCGFSYYRQA